ncbi:MAG: phospholipid carrier-dependent glycosyltransferase [Armatimonadetes bacterium]|nr:phospholipid carrier-dependent glycosyltransferase [Candidatus Hippobium faecium]
MKKKLFLYISFALIIILSAYLNFTGYRWGLPCPEHLYSYHPDEGINMGGAIRIFAGEKVPGFYNYSSLYFYIVSYVLSTASAWGILNIGESLTPDNLTVMYACGRITSIIFSVLSVGLCFMTGYRLKGIKAAVFAGVLFALCPIFVMHSKFIAVDVTVGFFVILTIFITTFIKIPEKGSPFSEENRKTFLVPLLLAGITSGLAMGVKYNGIEVFAVPTAYLIIILFQKKISIKDAILSLIFSGLCAVLVFLITTPGIFLDTHNFIKDFTYELNHIKTGHGDEFVNTGIGFFYTFRENMISGMGFLFSCVSAISVIVCLFIKNRYIKSISIFALIYYISISMGNVRFARYIIPLLSSFSLLAAYIMAEFWNRKSYLTKAVTLILFLLMIYSNIGDSMFYNHCFTEKEYRDCIYESMLKYRKGASVGFPTVPWYYTPPFLKETSVMRSQRYEFAKECKEFTLFCQKEEKDEWNSEYLKSTLPDFVIVSSIESYHKKRLNDPKYNEYINVLYDNYLKNITPVYGQNLCHQILLLSKPFIPRDMAYMQPSYTIWIRKDIAKKERAEKLK